MTQNTSSDIHARALRRVKVTTTYEYVPILGEILGSWRQVDVHRAGQTIELHLATPLQKYDVLIINGEEIPTPNR